jgi:hypothetical protein
MRLSLPPHDGAAVDDKGPKAKTPEEMKESETQKAIIEWLAWKKIFHYRNNSGAFVDAQKHFYRFGAIGSPDIVCVINGQYVGIEVKAPKGKQSENQREFQRALEGAGGKYILAFSIDDVEHAFDG